MVPSIVVPTLMIISMMVSTTVLKMMTIITSSGSFDSGTNADDNIDDGVDDGAKNDDNNNIKWFLR